MFVGIVVASVVVRVAASVVTSVAGVAVSVVSFGGGVVVIPLFISSISSFKFELMAAKIYLVNPILQRLQKSYPKSKLKPSMKTQLFPKASPAYYFQSMLKFYNFM